MSAFVNMGLPAAEGEPRSATRTNAMSVMSGLGSEISAIPTTQQIPLFRCLDSSGGLLKDELYLKSADTLRLINVRRKHLHNSESDTDGGLHLNTLIYNPREIVFGEQGFNSIQDFISTKSGTASFLELFDANVGRFMALTSPYNGTSGDYQNASAMMGGVQMGFSEKVLGFVTMVMDYQINQVARMGFGMEEVQSTVDPTRKAGMEMCISTGVNWQGVSANGVTRTVTATSMSASTWPTYKNYRIYFNPANATIKISNNDGVLKLITSTIPSGGQITPNRTWRHGIQTTNSQTKTMYINFVRFVGKNNDPNFFDGPE